MRAPSFFASLLLSLGALTAWAGPGAAQAPTRTITRSGLPVVVVEAPNSPWAVVQLHVRTLGEGITADEASAITALAAALTHAGGERGAPALRALGGETLTALTLDELVISDGVPAEHLGDALRVLDLRLREARRLQPTLLPVAPLTDAQVPPPVVRQLMAPGHPYALELDGKVDASRVAALAERLLRRDNVTLVIVTPQKAWTTIGQVNRTLRASLPRGGLGKHPPVGALSGTRVALGGGPASALKVGAGAPADVQASLWLPLPVPDEAAGNGAPSRVQQRAALLVIAELLGAQTGSAAALDWLAFDLPVAEGTQAEVRRLEELKALAGPLDNAAIATARARARTRLVAPQRRPAGLALSVGRAALLDVDDAAVDTALIALEPSVVQAVAGALVQGGRVTLRWPDDQAAGGAR